MALFEPVFPTRSGPQTDSILPSSSITPLSIFQANEDDTNSHADKLKQLYHSLANVPEELCPSSRPSSPSAQIRIERLQQRIKNAALNGRYIGDLIRLRCTERSSVAMPITRAKWKDKTDTKDASSFILPDTEEEWFEWERIQAKRRGQDDDTDATRNGLSALKQARSQSAEEKVKVWKAKLLSTQDDSREKSSSGAATKQNSQINFPVVKRSAALGAQKKGKGKPPGIRPSLFYGNAPARAHESGHGSIPATSQARSMSSVSRGAASRDARKTPVEDDAEVQSNKNDKLPSQPSTAKKTIADLEDTTFFLPPTFESIVMTSTPKPQKVMTESHNAKDDVEQNAQLQNDLNLEKNQQVIPQTSLVAEEKTPKAKRPLAAIVTPPPSTSRNALLRDKQTTLGDDTSRLLTPCSDDYTASHPITRPSQDHPIKKIRMTPSHSVLVPPSTPKAGEILSAAADLGNAKGLPINRTPDRNTLPTLNELLATSRRSKPRPRPPPRKSLVNNDGIVNMQSETQSVKAFISSPASGSTQATPSALRYIAQSSPVSPLFTQNPSQFAPALTSTQLAANGSPPAKLNRGSVARSASIKSTTASQGLLRASSGLLGMAYNSQFDVDRRIDQVADFLNKDVNFDAWIRDPDASQMELLSSQVSVPVDN